MDGRCEVEGRGRGAKYGFLLHGPIARLKLDSRMGLVLLFASACELCSSSSSYATVYSIECVATIMKGCARLVVHPVDLSE